MHETGAVLELRTGEGESMQIGVNGSIYGSIWLHFSMADGG